jgi:hypothetical protein
MKQFIRRHCNLFLVLHNEKQAVTCCRKSLCCVMTRSSTSAKARQMHPVVTVAWFSGSFECSQGILGKALCQRSLCKPLASPQHVSRCRKSCLSRFRFFFLSLLKGPCSPALSTEGVHVLCHWIGEATRRP